jgi:hypothetical protein
VRPTAVRSGQSSMPARSRNHRDRPGPHRGARGRQEALPGHAATSGGCRRGRERSAPEWPAMPRGVPAFRITHGDQTAPWEGARWARLAGSGVGGSSHEWPPSTHSHIRGMRAGRAVRRRRRGVAAHGTLESNGPPRFGGPSSSTDSGAYAAVTSSGDPPRGRGQSWPERRAHT